MNLEKLQSLGAFVGAAKFVPAEFEWTPDGGETPVKFKFTVKAEPSAADFEFVQFQGLGALDNSLMARRVHRLVRLVEVDGEKVTDGGQLPLEHALQLKTSLLIAFVAEINKVEAAQGKPASAKTKKPSPRSTSSGTNSSLTA